MDYDYMSLLFSPEMFLPHFKQRCLEEGGIFTKRKLVSYFLARYLLNGQQKLYNHFSVPESELVREFFGEVTIFLWN